LASVASSVFVAQSCEGRAEIDPAFLYLNLTSCFVSTRNAQPSRLAWSKE